MGIVAKPLGTNIYLGSTSRFYSCLPASTKATFCQFTQCSVRVTGGPLTKEQSTRCFENKDSCLLPHFYTATDKWDSWGLAFHGYFVMKLIVSQKSLKNPSSTRSGIDNIVCSLMYSNYFRQIPFIKNLDAALCICLYSRFCPNSARYFYS